MRILQINKFLYQKGGTETYLLSLIKLLEDNDHEVVCFSQKNQNNPVRPEEKYFMDELDLSRFSFNSLIKLPRIFWSFKAARRIKKLISQERPELVHLHNIYHQLSPSILPAIKKFHLPVVMTVHDFKLITPEYTLRADGQKPPHKGSRLIQKILNAEFRFHRWLDIYQRNIDLFITPSQFVKDQLMRAGFEEDKIKVIPHFLPAEFFPKLNNYSVQAGGYLFAYGRLDESKGFSDLLHALKELPIRGIKLKIAGNGPEEKKLKELIAELSLGQQVEFLGHQSKSEIIKLIKNSSVVINPSRVHETFGLAVLEAMALGKPVIATKTGAIPELIDNGRNGLLYEAGDIGELKEQLIKLLSDPKLSQQLAKEARAKAVKFKNPEKHLKLLLDAYQTAIKKHKNPLRRVNTLVLDIILAGTVFLLLSWPFYQLGIGESRALILNGHTSPKTANLYWRNPITPETAKELAQWDLLALDMTAQTYSAEAIKEIRKLNPQIIILAYTSANEMPTSRLNDVEPQGFGQWHNLAFGDQSAWHLKTWQGQEVVFWPGNVLMNLGVKNSNGQTYGDYLTDFYQKLLASGLWDGLLFDNTWSEACWLNADIDIDADGRKDDCAKINSQWQKNYNDFFGRLRSRIGDDYILIGNGNGDYSRYLNGRMLEGFPEYWEGGWVGQMESLAKSTAVGFSPRVNIVNSDSNNTGNKYDYQSMRFGLASALLFDAYYSFDYGPNLREHLWQYDEYKTNLGRPLQAAANLFNPLNTKFVQGVWQREFENGIALVNSTNQPQKISFDAEYEKIKSAQDQQANDGAIINQLILPANDGIILLKTLSRIYNGQFTNGSFARVYNNRDQIKRNGFFAYDGAFNGGNKVLYADLDNDGQTETIVTDKNSLTLEKAGQRKTIYPYGRNFTGGINSAIAKNNSGQTVIITAPNANGSNLIKFFDLELQATGQAFNAYSDQWKNLGATVAVCDLDGDQIDELITGAGYGGGPYVKVFRQNGELLKAWFAYNSNFRGGVNVACGIIDDSKQNKIVTGAGFSGGPHLRIFNQTGSVLGGWFAYSPSKRDGVKVVLSDMDNDGIKEIIALTENFLSK